MYSKTHLSRECASAQINITILFQWHSRYDMVQRVNKSKFDTPIIIGFDHFLYV